MRTCWVFALLLLGFSCLTIKLHAQTPTPTIISDDDAFVTSIKQQTVNGIVSGAHLLLYDAIGMPRSLLYMPVRRAALAIDDNTEARCLLFRLTTEERLNKYIFSEPLHFLLGQKLYQQAYAEPIPQTLLNVNNELISLVKLFEWKPSAKFLYLPVRNYGDVLEKSIAELPAKNIARRLTNDPHSSLSIMFFSKRAEFTIMYPGEVFEYRSQNPNLEYRSYKIAGAPNGVYARMMCNKHPVSEKYIARVNANLPVITANAALQDLHLRFNENAEKDTVLKMMETLEAYVGHNEVNTP